MRSWPIRLAPSKNSILVIPDPVASKDRFTFPPGKAWLKFDERTPVTSISLLVAISLAGTFSVKPSENVTTMSWSE